MTSANNYLEPGYNPPHLCKVPHVTLLFWIISIFAAMLGQTGGDAVAVNLNFGFGFSSGAFLLIFAALLTAQLAPPRFHPYVYWAVIVVASAVGTSFATFLNDTAQVGYGFGALFTFSVLAAVLFIWRGSLGGLKFEYICDPPHEIFYWFTLVLACTLGAALWNYVSLELGVNLVISFAIFGILLVITSVFHFHSGLPSVLLFWTAFAFSRAFGAGIGAILTRPQADGGLNLSYAAASLIALIVMVILIALTIRRHENPTTPLPA